MNIAETIQTLYQQYGQLSGVTIECQNDLVAIGIKNKAAKAEVFLQGAQLTRYQPTNEKPVIFLSEACDYKLGSPLRGGIPICWPWFGDLDRNPQSLQQQLTDQDAPAHGFVRSRQWDVKKIIAPADNLTIIELSYQTTTEEPLWPFATELVYRIEVGETLFVSLHISNVGDQPFEFSGALHTYLSVNHIKDTRIQGFDDSQYADALDSDNQGQWKIKQQEGDIHFRQEVDRVYRSGCSSVKLDDRLRQMSIDSTGSASTVIWNPWIDKAQKLSQFNDDDYQRMVCIETANAGVDTVTLEPGQEHSLSQTISV